MDIEITFINQSYDPNHSDVVIFQKNVSTSFEETAVAWKVIESAGRNWKHRFIFPATNYVAARDSWGNVIGLQLSEPGQKWNVARSPSGDTLTLDSQPAGSPNEIEIKNCLPAGSIDAQIYKDGKLLATKTGISPQQKSVFQFKPTIWVGLVSQVEEGEIMNPAILADINTEISLLGITKANLILTGGGDRKDAQPFKFTLELTE